MQTAYRITQPLQGHHVTIELPADFPECSAVDIIVLAQSQEAPPLTTENWLASVWGSSPNFPDRPEQPPLQAIEPL